MKFSLQTEKGKCLWGEVRGFTMLSEDQWASFGKLCAALGLSVTDVEKPEVDAIISSIPPVVRDRLLFALSLLARRAPSLLLTHTFTPIKDSTVADVQQLLSTHLDSQIVSLVLSVAVRSWCAARAARFGNAYEQGDSSATKELQRIEPTRNGPPITLPRVRIPRGPNGYQLHADVCIVGSGSSALISALLAASAGFKVLVCERGYLLNSITAPALPYMREREAFFRNSLDCSADGSLSVLAAQTVGGSLTTSWGSLQKLSDERKREWDQLLGTEFFSTNKFNDAERRVLELLGENLLATNSSPLVSVQGSKLGCKPVKTVAQQSTSLFVERKSFTAELLKRAVELGVRVMQRTNVTRIRHRNGKAEGLDVIAGGGRAVTINCKRVVCAAGALGTPALLLRSQFCNGNIGSGLRTQPSVSVCGVFETPQQAETAAQTASLDAVEDKNANIIRTVSATPSFMVRTLAWRSASDWQYSIDKLNQTCALLVTASDEGSGEVKLDKDTLPVAYYTPSTQDREKLKAGIITAAWMLYLGGATEIRSSCADWPPFITTKPISERSLSDKEFCQWQHEMAKKDLSLFGTKFLSVHQMGSCRMGNDDLHIAPVDVRGRLRECRNVHVLDNSVFPAAAGVDPMVTGMATSSVFTEYMLQELTKSRM